VPYLIVRRVPQLIGFLKTAFGATEEQRTDLRDGTVTHAQLRVRDSVVMLCEARADWPPMPTAIYLYVRDCDAAFDRAIAAGATMLTLPTDSPDARTASVQDPSGNLWFLATHKPAPATPIGPQVKAFTTSRQPSFAASRTPR
jgi:uncharacterized glyoxalase superfamily protein PhnB